MKNPYPDIINLPHHRSSHHPHMPRDKRAAQFAPFAALTGHEEATLEVARLTDKKVELDEYIKAQLNKKLHTIQVHKDMKPVVSIRYFQKDHLKEGGSYLIVCGYIKKIDKYEGLVIMGDGKEVLIEDIVDIESKLFAKLRD